MWGGQNAETSFPKIEEVGSSLQPKGNNFLINFVPFSPYSHLLPPIAPRKTRRVITILPSLFIEMKPDRGRVYDLCRVYHFSRPVFSGNNARVRRRAKVQKIVRTNSLQLKGIGELKLVEILCQLLEEKVFESEDVAKVKFPALFPDVQRQASNSADALDKIAPRDKVEDGTGLELPAGTFYKAVDN